MVVGKVFGDRVMMMMMMILTCYPAVAWERDRAANPICTYITEGKLPTL